MQTLTPYEVTILRQSLKCTLTNLQDLDNSPDSEADKELFLDSAHETVSLLQSAINKLNF